MNTHPDNEDTDLNDAEEMGLPAEPVQTLRVEKTLPDERLDSFLRARLPDVSRNALRRLIDRGNILVNGQPSKASHHPHADEEITIRWPHPRPALSQPEDIPLNILFEDECLLVLNKPAGMVVHPGTGHADHTLVNALLHHCSGQLSGIGGVARPGIVHRLDKDTSGCLVVAKADNTHMVLAQQFAARNVTKIYQAIVIGELEHDSGTINAAISRHPSHRKRMIAQEDQGGRPAKTSFRVLERLRLATWIEAELHTGRTHQVRVHFKHIGHPLVGDQVYAQRQNRRLEELSGYTAPRQMLHAHRLGFKHPRTAELIEVEAPLPEDFLDAVRRLRTRTT